jgi:protease-4
MSDGNDTTRWTDGPEVKSTREQRRTRRWGILFKSLFLGYLVALLVLFRYDSAEVPDMSDGRHTALVDLSGVIAADSDADADTIAGGLRAAFEDDGTAGVILRINSPGGSPVQARYIYDEIRRLRGLHPDIPLYAVIPRTASTRRIRAWSGRSACAWTVSAWSMPSTSSASSGG